MSKPASGRDRLRPVNSEETLYEVASREIWQCDVVTADGALVGRAVREIVEPRAYLVRYIIVFDFTNGRRLLVPATLVTGVKEGTILCNLDAGEVPLLPEYQETLSREEELATYQNLARTPYWVEEAAYSGLLGSGRHFVPSDPLPDDTNPTP